MTLHFDAGLAPIGGHVEGPPFSLADLERTCAAPPNVREFVPAVAAGDEHPTDARLDAWLAQFAREVLFTVVVLAARRCPLEKQIVHRPEHHRHLSAAAARRLAERHEGRVQRIEPERISAASLSAAIQHFGTCE
jgi:hypothetical protein